jgi:hypothetical protein
MLIVGLRDYDIILSHKWFTQTSVLIDCKNQKLLWPDDQSRTRSYNKTLITTKEALEPERKNPLYQVDVDKRDKLQAMSETWRPQILKCEPLLASSQSEIQGRT